MEQTLSKKEGFWFWFHTSAAARKMRFTVLCILLLAYSFGSLQKETSAIDKKYQDYSSPELLYSPATFVTGDINTRNLAVITATSREEFARFERNCQLRIAQLYFDSGNRILYTAKPSDSSTHVYQYTESIPDHSLNNRVAAKPKSLVTEDGITKIRWHHELRDGIVPSSIVIALVISFALPALICAFLNPWLRRRWNKKLQPAS